MDERSRGGADGPSPTPELVGAVRATRQLFGAAACSCALADDAGEHLRFVAADGAGAEAITGVVIPATRGIAGWVAMTGQAIAIADVERDARFARDVAESTEYVPRTILAAPLMSSEGEVSGVLEVLDPRHGGHDARLGDHAGSDAELAVLTLVASQVSVTVQLADELGRLQERVLPSSTATGPDGDALVAALRSLVEAGPEGTRLARRVLDAVTEFVRSGR